MRNNVIVAKLIGYAQKVLGYCEGLNYEQFCADTKLIEACVFNLSQMGELANRLDSDFTQKHADIPWHALYGLRNRIVHDYEGVNLSLIWEIIDGDLQPLLVLLTQI